MKEIKFRAWQDNMMLISPLSSNYGLQRFFGHLYEDTPVMQFTGLTDNNGKDIYEGDVCRIRGIGGQKAVVTYIKGGFRLGDHVPLYFDNDKSEIIGNIYENPDLLTNTEVK